MLTLIVILFVSGILTILLPCILPLLPIVLGTSIAGRSKWRPLMVVLGMALSFVAFTFLLNVALAQFPEAAEYVRIATFYVLLLFGTGFLTADRRMQFLVAVLGASFFWPEILAVFTAAVLGCIATHWGSRVASSLQNVGANIQQKTQGELRRDHPLGGLIIGSTLGLVWVPCAGPALSFVFTLLRDRPGFEAFLLLVSYAMGTALPLLLVGYGGQWAVHSVRTFSAWSQQVKQIAGALLIFSALALQFHWFLTIETWLVQHTSYGTFGTGLEERFFGEKIEGERGKIDDALLE